MTVYRLRSCLQSTTSDSTQVFRQSDASSSVAELTGSMVASSTPLYLVGSRFITQLKNVGSTWVCPCIYILGQGAIKIKETQLRAFLCIKKALLMSLRICSLTKAGDCSQHSIRH